MDADGSVEGAEEEPQVRGAFDLHQGPELVHFKTSLQHIIFIIIIVIYIVNIMEDLIITRGY